MSQSGGGKVSAWFKIARLQFYPMVLILYAAGSLAAASRFGGFNWPLFLYGYACLFLIELATVLTNEYFDYPSDAINKNAGRFTGGSRVLVDKRLSFDAVAAGACLVVVVLALVATAFLTIMPMDRVPSVLTLLALGLVLGLEYTAKPLRLSYVGLGEVNVAFTHSIYVLLIGWVIQGGPWSDKLPWLVGLPAFFAVLAANSLAGIPDHKADKEVRKRSYSVLWGQPAAAVIAMAAAFIAATGGVFLWAMNFVGSMVGVMFVFTIVHAVALMAMLFAFIGSKDYDRRIDATMVNALTFILWFGIIPLVHFLVT